MQKLSDIGMIFAVIFILAGVRARARSTQAESPQTDQQIARPSINGGQRSADEVSPSWLHPSDAEYAQAIEGGSFSSKRTSEYAEPTIKSGVNWAMGKGFSRARKFSLVSPLLCAATLASEARKQLQNAPTLQNAKGICDGVLIVLASRTSGGGALGRLYLVIDVGRQRIQPVQNLQGGDRIQTAEWPSVYVPGEHPIYQPGWYSSWYTSEDVFLFQPTEAIETNAAIVWSDDSGKIHQEKADFSELAKDEIQHRDKGAKR